MSLSAGFARLEARSEAIFHRLASPFDPQLYRGCVEFVRVVFALVMFLRYARTLDALYLFPHQSPLLIGSFLVLYLFLAAGLLTPWVLLTLLVLEGITPLFIAVKVNALLPLALLLLGAGAARSLDARWFAASWWVKSARERAELFPRVRIYLALPYAVLSLIAFVGHLRDEWWHSSQALTQVLGNPVISRLPESLRSWLVGEPWLVTLMSWAQLAWEALLLPSLFFAWPFLLTGLYGWSFFFVTLFILNLSSLGTLESLYWLLIFHQEMLQALRRWVRRA